jgi:GNAT superfamily N-acetyltransferase
MLRSRPSPRAARSASCGSSTSATRGELAVEVVDWQGCGVGTQLLQAARDRAATMGYRELARTVRPGLPTDAGAKRRTVDAVALGLGLSEDACAVS